MEFKDIVTQRYATKMFDGKTVPEETINELLEYIRLSASALNLQPWKCKVITDKKLKEDLTPATFNQPQVASCSHLLVFCGNIDVDGQIEKVDKSMKDAGRPDEIRERMMGMARGMAGNRSDEEIIAWTKCHAYLALGNAINGAKALGLDSCPMGGFDPKAYSDILDLPDNLIPALLCAVGYAADKPIPKVRLSKEEMFF